MNCNITLGGTGGQGLVMAGIIFAEAAMLEKHNVLQSQSYGPEARGGASKSDIIISSEEIDYPKVLKTDILLAMSQMAEDKYLDTLSPTGIMIVDTTFVKNIPATNGKIYMLPITRTIQDKLKSPLSASIAALGAIVAITQVVKLESLLEAVKHRVPKGTDELNCAAVKLGFEMGKEASKN